MHMCNMSTITQAAHACTFKLGQIPIISECYNTISPVSGIHVHI